MLVFVIALAASALLGTWFGYKQLIYGFDRGYSSAMEWEERALLYMAEREQYAEAIAFIDAKLAVSTPDEHRKIRQSLPSV